MRHTQYFRRRWRSLAAVVTLGGLGFWLAIAPVPHPQALAQTASPGVITLRADIQEANANTGVIVARGNVRIDYPARDIVATSAQAQYFSNENRMILSGNVVVLQEGNRLQAEVVTYLVDEGRFIAMPQPNEQVETTYIIQDNPTAQPGDGTATDEAPTGAADAITPDETLLIAPLEPPTLPDTE
ncbi:LptA/OstA family protein [Halomicronema sp. CCY15110]|uniref:LptA/OstA family protein n=1 Tax=Halomicronema sp. CCY15110 TaxID=2767773 RepID=UPI00195137AF|nr:LptA/OstA family protein [Halomicronema sp. CCY15110]